MNRMCDGNVVNLEAGMSYLNITTSVGWSYRIQREYCNNSVPLRAIVRVEA